ncbi:MAG: (d)CMP kinase [Phycisphaerales bacterium]
MPATSATSSDRITTVHTAQLIITIDGPAGTGKSSVAHRLARRLGLDFLDTGAMYRGAALVALETGVDPSDGPGLAAALEHCGMRFDWTADPPRIMLGDRDISPRIREMDVSGMVSIVAAQPEVRRMLIAWQRRIGGEHPRLVTEGRDQGSAVFPAAPVKFYMHADVDVRAERRVRQLEASGRTVATDDVRQDIRRRDELDTTRADSPLVRPDAAVDVDTSSRTLDEVVDLMEAEVRARLGERLAPPASPGGGSPA